MAELLWQKPGVAVDAQIQRFLAGDDVILDREFFLYDIAASKAHAQGLQRIGILSQGELDGLSRESFRVAHGSGSDPKHNGYLERFSNEFGSYATSNGAYTTGDYYHGKYGLSMKTHGRDWTNYHAEPRAIARSSSSGVTSFNSAIASST